MASDELISLDKLAKIDYHHIETINGGEISEELTELFLTRKSSVDINKLTICNKKYRKVGELALKMKLKKNNYLTLFGKKQDFYIKVRKKLIELSELKKYSSKVSVHTVYRQNRAIARIETDTNMQVYIYFILRGDKILFLRDPNIAFQKEIIHRWMPLDSYKSSNRKQYQHSKLPTWKKALENNKSQ